MTEESDLPEIKGKVAWLCTYTPEELIRAAGFLPYRPAVKAESFDRKSGYLPGNLCPYVRGAAYKLLQIEEEELAGAVIANSCNAMMHLYNMLRAESELPVFMLDLPRQRGQSARKYFSSSLQEMTGFLQELGGEIEPGQLQNIMKMYKKTLEILRDLPGGIDENIKENEDSSRVKQKYFKAGFIDDELGRRAFSEERDEFNKKLWERFHDGSREKEVFPDLSGQKKFILTGAQPHPAMTRVFRENGGAVFHDHCQGFRYWQKNYDISRAQSAAGLQNSNECEKSHKDKEIPGEDNIDILLQHLADVYLQKPICPRFSDYGARQNFYEDLLAVYDFAGVVFHNLNFCDYAHYDYLRLKDFFQNREIPVLNLATELSSGDKGQLRTRIEAFIEIV